MPRDRSETRKNFLLKKEAKTFAIRCARRRTARLLKQKLFGAFSQKRTAVCPC
jgi:hypothetical protein